MEVIGVIVFVVLVILAVCSSAKKHGQETENNPPPFSSSASTLIKCSACGHLLHTVSDPNLFGFWGKPFRYCPGCGKEFYDQYYHELALSDSLQHPSFSFEAGTREKEIEASRLRLKTPGYPAKLLDYLDPKDEKGRKALESVIESDMRQYINLLHQKVIHPLPAFRLNNPNLFTSLSYEAHDKKAVQQVVNAVLLHFGLDPTYFQVEVEYNPSEGIPEHGTRGSFTRGFVKGGNIKIVLQNHHSEYDTVVSIVLHECAHAYLAAHGISLEDKQNNERLTDAAVIFLGGGKYLLRGYYASHAWRIGYLYKAESEACMRLVDLLNDSIKGKAAQEKTQLLSALSDRSKNLRNLKTRIDQLMQNIHPARVIREESIQNRFYQDWKTTQTHLTQAEALLNQIKDVHSLSTQKIQEKIEACIALEKHFTAFLNVLLEWQEAERWQSSLPEAVLQSARGVGALVESRNAFALLERIKFWSACPSTRADAELYLGRLLLEDTPDFLCAAGICYLNGFAVPKDKTVALKYLTQAAALDSKDAIKILNEQFRA